MKIVKPAVYLIDEIDGEKILKKIEEIGRTCYKSDGTQQSAEKFVKNLLKRGHDAMIEHYSISVRVICDRGITHEIVRHRLFSFAQTSTRYCNYASDKFENEISVICPFENDENYTENYKTWRNTCELAENSYLYLIKNDVSPQIARAVLPTCLATEIVMTANLREWRHFFKLRLSSRAHPQMREIAEMIIKLFREKIPVIFDDIEIQET